MNMKNKLQHKPNRKKIKTIETVFFEAVYLTPATVRATGTSSGAGVVAYSVPAPIFSLETKLLEIKLTAKNNPWDAQVRTNSVLAQY